MSVQSLCFDGRAVVLSEDQLPSPLAGQVRIRSEWTQVSIGTETAWIREHRAAGKPVGLGYSHVGIIEELGPGVAGWEIGQRVLSCSPHAALVNAPAADLVAVPDGLSPDLAAIGVIGSIAYHIVQRAAPRMLEATAVIGQGVVGSLVLQLAHSCGAEPLIAIDADPSRLNAARAIGAHVIDASCEDVAARVAEI
nr:alcohol dehydrogenase catalytic domain-containing protein [Planctomycetota bacterium]